MRNILAVLGGGAGAVGVVAVGSVLVAAGFYIQQGRNAAQATDQVNASLSKPKTAAVPAAPQQPEADAAASAPSEGNTNSSSPAPEIMTSAPAFDEVRREADGMTVIAGRGAPGTVVSILQNGVEIATSKVDRAGKFATLAVIPPDGLGHSLTLSQETAKGPLKSEGEILLAPLAAPIVVAEAKEPAATTELVGAETGVAVELAANEPVTTSVEGNAASVTQPASGDAGKTEPLAQAATDIEAQQETVEVAQALQDVEKDGLVAVATGAGSESVDAAATAETAVTIAAAPQVDPAKALSLTAKESPSPANGITTELVEVDTDAASRTLTQDQAPSADIAAEEQVVAALDPAAPQAPRPPAAILRSTAAGVELLNPVIPEVMDNVAIDTISYSESGEVQLAGRAQSNAVSVRVYLDNKSVVVLAVDAQGRWRGDVPNVDEGIYTLRVDEVSGTGKISSRVETPFKREPLEVLAAAAALQDGPINAITVQSGATLWAIARDRYGSGELYVRVFEANKDAIRDPDLIYPGQIFELPE